jgi:hypothetical protein
MSKKEIQKSTKSIIVGNIEDNTFELNSDNNFADGLKEGVNAFEDNPIAATEAIVTDGPYASSLKTGFFNAGINPYNGESLAPTGEFHNIFTIADVRYARMAEHPFYDKSERFNEITGIHHIRKSIESVFNIHAQYLFNQMINFANQRYSSMLEEALTKEGTEECREFLCYYINKWPFNIMPFGCYTDGEFKYDNEGVHFYSCSIMPGDLFNFHVYRTNDYFVMFNMLYPVLTAEANKFYNELAASAANDKIYSIAVDIFNRETVFLLEALENVVCNLHCYAATLYEAGMPDLHGMSQEDAMRAVVCLAREKALEDNGGSDDEDTTEDKVTE